MPGKIFATPSLKERVRQLRQGSAEPGITPRGATRTPAPAGVSNTLAERSGKLSDTEHVRLLPGLVRGASPPTSVPSRRTTAAGLPVGILLYLVSVGLVATATIGVFFGIGFFLLAHPTGEMIAGSGPHDRGTEVDLQRSGDFPRPYSDIPPADREAAPVSGETEMSRSTAPAALPVFQLVQRPAVQEPAPPEESDAARGSLPLSPDGEASATAAQGAPPSGEGPPLRSTAGEATITAPAQAASAPPADREGAPVSGETKMPRSTAATALPVFPLAQRPAVEEAAPPEESDAVRGSVPLSSDGEASASAAKGAPPSGEVPPLRSTAGEATITAPAQSASALSPPASPALPPASSHLFVAEIAKSLAALRARRAAEGMITFEQYRDFRIHDLMQRRVRLAQQLAAPNLSASEKKRLERRNTSYDRLAAMPAKERDRRFRERFDEIDANHDGKLDPEERAAWREKQREYYQQQATERAINRFPDSAQALTTPQAGQTNPFAERALNK